MKAPGLERRFGLRGRPPESGFTLVEVLVTAAILMIVLAAVYSLLFSVQRGFNREVDRAQSIEQARLAVEQIQKEVLSARAVTVPNGVTMDVYTRTNETTRTSSQVSQCVRWRVTSGGVLQSQRWTPPYGAGASATVVVVATDIVNTPTDWLFQIDPNTAYARRLVNISVRTNANPEIGNDVVVDTSVLGMNITPGVEDVCATNQPSWPS